MRGLGWGGFHMACARTSQKRPRSRVLQGVREVKERWARGDSLFFRLLFSSFDEGRGTALCLIHDV